MEDVGGFVRKLRDACAFGGPTAIRRVVRLEPAGGPADKVFPPTMPGEGQGGWQYLKEQRRSGDHVVDTVCLDTVQSQANRLEAALLAANRVGRCPMPMVSVRVEGRGEVSVLERSHRIYDGLFNASTIHQDGSSVPFRTSTIGQAIAGASDAFATPLLQYCPVSLILGCWDSFSGRKEMAARFPRMLTSEITGYDAVEGTHSAVRTDRLGIGKGAMPMFATDNAAKPWRWTADEAEAVKQGKGAKGKPQSVDPADIGLGNIISNRNRRAPGGVTVREGRQVSVLSLARLRQIHFPSDPDAAIDPERDVAAHTVLASLALYALALQWVEGYQLRSRCLLIPTGDAPLYEPVGGGTAVGFDAPFALDVDDAREVFLAAAGEARRAGLPWNTETLRLEAVPEVVSLIRASDRRRESWTTPDEDSAAAEE